MARLGLKLFHLRTRVRRLSQQQLADELGMRQATLSHIERGQSLPQLPLLLLLCQFFDVTPTWLLDDARGFEVLPSDRWSMRHGLLTTGMSVECSEDALEDLGESKRLLRLGEGLSFYDEEAATVRRDAGGAAEAAKQLGERRSQRADEEDALIQELEAELQKHPRRRKQPD